MMGHMKSCDVLVRQSGVDSLGEPSETFVVDRQADIAISVNSGSKEFANNVLGIRGDYVAVTDDKCITKANRLRQGGVTYAVESINILGRKAIYYLKAVS